MTMSLLVAVVVRVDGRFGPPASPTLAPTFGGRGLCLLPCTGYLPPLLLTHSRHHRLSARSCASVQRLRRRPGRLKSKQSSRRSRASLRQHQTTQLLGAANGLAIMSLTGEGFANGVGLRCEEKPSASNSRSWGSKH